MKITFLLTQDLNSPSSLGRFYPLAKELIKFGHTIKIFTLHSNYYSLIEKKLQIDHIEIKYVGQMQVKKIGDTKIYFNPIILLILMSLATIKFVKYALFGNYDVLYIGKPHPMNGIAGLLGKWFRRKKLIVDCDDLESDVNNFSNKFQKRIVSYFENFLPISADLVNTNTSFSFQRLLNIGVSSKRIYLLPNGIDRNRFSNQNWELSKLLKNELNLNNKSVIGYIGTISLKSHPVDILVDAFLGVIEILPNSHLLLVGGGEDIQAIRLKIKELKIEESVSIIGRVIPEDIPSYYNLCDVTVDPVKNNNVAKARLPIKMFESWAVGIPFVTSDVGDRKEYLYEPICGVCAISDEAIDLKDAILKILLDKNLKQEIIANGLQKVKSFYWDTLVIDYQEFLKKINYASNQ